MAVKPRIKLDKKEAKKGDIVEPSFHRPASVV